MIGPNLRHTGCPTYPHNYDERGKMKSSEEEEEVKRRRGEIKSLHAFGISSEGKDSFFIYHEGQESQHLLLQKCMASDILDQSISQLSMHGGSSSSPSSSARRESRSLSLLGKASLRFKYAAASRSAFTLSFIEGVLFFILDVRASTSSLFRAAWELAAPRRSAMAIFILNFNVAVAI